MKTPTFDTLEPCKKDSGSSKSKEKTMNILTIGQVIVIDDFLSDFAIDSLERGDYFVRSHHDERAAGITCRQKWVIDCAPVAVELEQFIDSIELRETIRSWADLSWRLVYNNCIEKTEIEISEYETKAGFDWHVDHWSNHRALNWMMTIQGDSWMEWTNDAWSVGYRPAKGETVAIDMPPNQLVVMPSYYPHRICVSEDRRISLHGHFNSAGTF